jgi:predicted nucleic acid-binding Zn ribbon protein
MKHTNEHTLKQALKEMLKAYRLEGKLAEIRVIKAWPQVTGKLINRHTRNIYISKKKLFVRIDSPAIKNELFYNRQKVVELLNQEAGEKVIEEIVFI